MPAPSLPSRHQWNRIANFRRRLDVILAVLDALPDRRGPLASDVAARFRRTLSEGRALLGMPPNRALSRTLQPVDFLLESILILHRLRDLKAAEIKSRDRSSAACPWMVSSA